MRHWFLTGLLVIIVAVTGAALIVRSSGTPTTTAPTPEVPQQTPLQGPSQQGYDTIDMKTMIGDYDRNQVAADQTYKGKAIKLSGWVDNISRDITNNPYVILHPTAEENYLGTYVHCSTNESEAVKLANGQFVTMTGTVEGMSLGIITVKDCAVAQ